jgi:glycosyltransferase involved in cell wall biosynthesis
MVTGLAPGDALLELFNRWLPDVVVVTAGGRYFHDWTRPLVTSARGVVPCVLYLHDSDALELLGEPQIEPEVVWGCADTRTAAARDAGFDAITIPPLVEPSRYRTISTREVVLYVNPVKSKGVRVAITLAALLRDIPFVFLRSWNLHEPYLTELRGMADALGNIELTGPTDDVRQHYARARVLLAPYDDLSRPRVVSEAQLSGIPAVACDDAGFREVVGPGGILVPRDAAMTQWVRALSLLWGDDDAYQRYSEAALRYVERPEGSAKAIVATVEESLRDAVSKFAKARRSPISPRSTALVSVVIPVFQGATFLGEQLEALSRQTYRGKWELLISDNGSTDGTLGRALAWQGTLPLRIVDASRRRGVAHARNAAVEAARGEYILICDADDVVDQQWMEYMVEALSQHDIVTGRGDRQLLNPPDLFEWMGEVDQSDAESDYGYLRYAAGGNLGMRREVAQTLAGFDESLLRAEDIDWSWRAQYAGYEVHFEERAVVHYRHASGIRTVMSKCFRGGMTEPLLYRRHRHRGLQASPHAEALETWRWLWRNAPAALREPALTNRWIANLARRSGRVVGSARHRSLFL